MPLAPFAAWMIEQEARALLTRLAHVKPLAMQESMLPAAGLLPESQTAIEQFLMTGRSHLRILVMRFLDWLRSPAAARSDAEKAQRRSPDLRLRFNAVLTHFDLFENVITQRSENETGVWLSGLDVVSADALYLRGNYYQAPPVVCYLDRGLGGRFAVPALACLAAATIPWPLSKSRGNAWSAAESRPRWFTRRDIRQRLCFSWSSHCGLCSARWLNNGLRRFWRGNCGSGGFPRSWRTCGRSVGLESHPRWG